MSLLPARFQTSDDMPMSLGKAIARAIAPKVDPNAWFDAEGAKHPRDRPPEFYAWCREQEQIKGAASKDTVMGSAVASGAAPPSAKFKVGTVYLVPEDTTDWFRKFFAEGWGIAHSTAKRAAEEERAFITFAKCRDICSEFDVIAREITPTPDAEGWRTHRPGDPCPIPGVKAGHYEVRRADGSTRAFENLHAAMCSGWGSIGQYEFVAYRAVKP